MTAAIDFALCPTAPAEFVRHAERVIRCPRLYPTHALETLSADCRVYGRLDLAYDLDVIVRVRRTGYVIYPAHN